ncbi:MAG TPA: type II secretion system secretin GspD [Rhizomicrobium sp.]|jgi:general secretion pathway protein D|nr:type II secretion system secretin GspD [Rhizomicrobium sp.]
MKGLRSKLFAVVLSAAALGCVMTPAFAQAPNAPAQNSNDVTLNFPNVDVHEAAKAILGDILGLNYAVDPSVSGTVTVVTAHPVAKGDVFPVLEDSLKAANLGLVKRGAVYTIVPLAEAKRQPQFVTAGEPAYGTEAVELHFVNAPELKKLLDPLVPQNAISQADAGRNILLIQGSTEERKSIRDLIQQFDVNWLRGMSFVLLVPEHADAKTLMPELDSLMNAQGAPTAGLVRLIPIEHLNGILAISSQKQYLDDVKRWMDMLDREGETSERRLFVYRVQNGKASDLATVLVNAFGGSTSHNGPSPTVGTKPQQNSLPGILASALQQQQQMQSNGGNSTGSSSGQSSVFSSDEAVTNGTDTGSGGTTAPVSQLLILSGSTSPITVTSDDSNNAIVVYATPRQYNIIEDALHKLDVLPLQVLIEAAITEVTLTDQLQYGLQWSFQAGQSQTILGSGITSALLPAFPGFNYIFSNNSTIQATLNALSNITKVNVLSAPKLLVLNNHTAALQVGDEVPIITASAVSTDTTSAPIVNSVDYRDTGVILKVTPRVNDGGLVLLDISQEVSDVVNPTTGAIQSPTISERKVASSIAIQDGQTVALGGLITDKRTKGKEGIPLLDKIPLLGNLFGSTDDEHDRTELLVLLTPRVIRSATQAQAITDELKEKIHSAEPLPPSRVFHP